MRHSKHILATFALLVSSAFASSAFVSSAFAQPATPGNAAAVAAPLAAVDVEHAPGRPYFSPTEKFAAKTGADIYASVCIGCHMAGGKGAVGAGMYPALANNAKLATPTYIEYIVINGHKAMPPFGNALDDAQIAEVVNYVRTHFGNTATDSVSAADIKSVRPAPVAKP